jgi:non-ribosomal peptide synthetase-like protein
VVYAFYIAGLKRLVLGRAKPGVYAVESVFYLRKWFVDELMKAARAMLLPLYTTLYFPYWLRLLGAKVGARAELSTIWYFSPELLDIGEESFFADGSIAGGRRFHRGRFEIGVNRVGRRSFVGNSAILPVGAGLADKCLLGVLSIPPSHVEDGSEWLGSPAFALPNRQKLGGFSDAVTYRPTPNLYVQRGVIDALRILIPGYIGLGAAVVLAVFFYLARMRLSVAGFFFVTPLMAILLGSAASLAVVALKKMVMGKFEPVIRPLWSVYVWLNEMINGVYESVMAPAMMPFLGTPFLIPFLRLMGCKIGRHTYIDTTLFSEWDLVEIGDYAALNYGAIIQTHLFEDRVMKSSYSKVGAECTVGNMAVVLYDTQMHRGASLGPLSLLMKGETLSANGRWHGIPTVQVADR